MVNAFSGLKVSKKIAADDRVSEQAVKWTVFIGRGMATLKAD